MIRFARASQRCRLRLEEVLRVGPRVEGIKQFSDTPPRAALPERIPLMAAKLKRLVPTAASGGSRPSMHIGCPSATPRRGGADPQAGLLHPSPDPPTRPLARPSHEGSTPPTGAIPRPTRRAGALWPTGASAAVRSTAQPLGPARAASLSLRCGHRQLRCARVQDCVSSRVSASLLNQPNRNSTTQRVDSTTGAVHPPTPPFPLFSERERGRGRAGGARERGSLRDAE